MLSKTADAACFVTGTFSRRNGTPLPENASASLYKQTMQMPLLLLKLLICTSIFPCEEAAMPKSTSRHGNSTFFNIRLIQLFVTGSSFGANLIFYASGELMNSKFLHVFIFFVIAFVPACQQKKQERSNIVQSIQETGQLVTAEYTLQKMVKANDNQTWYKLGDRRILISVEAIVKAGINLQQVKKDDVKIRDSVIQLQLPRPTIFSVSLPPDKIEVKFESVSFFRNQFSAAEREGLLQQAETQVLQLARSLGILETAQTNAVTFLRRLLLQEGFKEVKITFAK